MSCCKKKDDSMMDKLVLSFQTNCENIDDFPEKVNAKLDSFIKLLEQDKKTTTRKAFFEAILKTKPLHRACHYNNHVVLTWLVNSFKQLGHDVTLLVNQQDKYGLTTLYLTVSQGQGTPD